MHREEIAFFDVDHTITKMTTSLAFIFVCIQKGYIKIWYIVSAPFLFILYRLFKLDMEFLYRFSLPKIYGIKRSEFESISKIAFDKYIKKNIYQGALDEINFLHNQGIRVILATSSPFEAVYPLAQYCGLTADDIVATRFAYSKDIFDGKLIGVPVYSKYKSNIIQTYIQKSGYDMQSCSFYSDSIHDLPLLEQVGFPVATNPDHRLKKHAKKKGWQIKDFKYEKK